MRYAKRFAAFWYDFLIGDDWLVAAGVALAVALTALVAHRNLPAWWIMPVAIAGLLYASLLRATRRR